MLYREIMEKVKSGEITLDFRGHSINHRFKNAMIAEYEDNIACSNGSNDGKWTIASDSKDSVEDVDMQMRMVFQKTLDVDVKENEFCYQFRCERECRACGGRLGFILNGNKLVLSAYFNGKAFVQHPPEYVCDYSVPKPFKGTIEIASKLVFANFFKHVEDAPQKKKHDSEYSLSTLRGLEGITKYKAKHNIAFGCMSNMSIGIFVHPNKKSIIIGDPYIADKRMEALPKKEYKKAKKKDYQDIEGHKLIGEISLEVWRWEATDVKTLGDHYKPYLKMFKERCIDVVETEVEHGTWDFEQYFSSSTEHDPGDDMDVYARFTLRE